MDFQVFTDKAKEKTRNATSQATVYFKAHWIDYLLIFFILLVLGTFDIFTLKRSDKFLTIEYWTHAGCRMTAYVFAGILGIRIGYPKAKVANQALWRAIGKNRHLILLKELNDEAFSDFIGQINLETKIAAWKAKITAKLERLNKFSPHVFLIYYKNPKENFFERYRFKKLWEKRAEKYCYKRKSLETLLTDEYINENINAVKLRFPVVEETHFKQIVGINEKFKTYHTSARVKDNAAKKIGSGILVTALIALISGSVMLSIDESLAAERVLGIVSIVVNALLDVGLTLYKYASARMDCPRIVEQEDLRSVLDQNEILLRFKKTLPPENISEYDKAVEELKQEEKELAEERA